MNPMSDTDRKLLGYLSALQEDGTVKDGEWYGVQFNFRLLSGTVRMHLPIVQPLGGKEPGSQDSVIQSPSVKEH